ncbi:MULTISPECIES: P-type conjugative transfer protein TrbL [unclassified Caballeronia]|uniref:P-type conjugative transfer protein TrbL n=1 Tax=unclassified Caballeronia TaxID=2646786 RepID=UPI002855AEC7|nr:MULTISPECIES: P-type conjugative transfer protein TrbL [unclassified Caballeronia]MDR5777010.1 P-type conjugative transfer protein TrbL [Caballeronia sp. LZ002]MDR5852415.1 P-type conjugative transfer protein TrbL [Caballeronia sp. LZ003]
MNPIAFLIPTAWRTRKGARFVSFAVIAMLLMTAVLSAHAQSSDTSFSLLNGVQAKFQPLQLQWGAKIKVYAERLFWALAAVDFGWTCITYIIDKNDIADMLGSLIRKMMTISFFFILLKMSDTWIPMIINSFTQIGQDAAGSGASATPDQIVSTGWSTALAMFQALQNKGMSEKIAMALPVTALSILCFLSFLFVAVQLLVTLIETYIAIGAGIIMLGFGGSRWTTDMASKYMQYAVATGVKLMVIYLIVGAGQSLFDSTTMIDADQFIKSCMTAMGAGFVYAYLAFQVPAMASAMMSGSPSMTAGGMAGAALTAGAAMAGAGAAVAAGGMGAAKGAGGAAAGATGLAKALSAGINSGLDLGKSGTAAVAHGLGQVGAHGLGMASGSIGDAVGGARSNFAQSVDKSAGGKIASSIEATRGGSVSGIPVPQSSAANVAPASQSAGSQSASNGTTATSSSPQSSPTGDAASTGAAVPEATAHAAEPVSSSVAGGIPGADSAVGSVAGSSAQVAQPPIAAPGAAGAGSAAQAGAAQPGVSASNAGGATPSAATSSSPAHSAAPASASAGSMGSGSSTATPSPTSTTSQMAPSSAQAPAGDASNASISSDGQAGGNGPASSRDDPLHKRIQDLQGYVPQDSAHAASVNIDFKHTQD